MKRTGNSKIAVVGWGRGMGHKGHMYLADAVITQAINMKADPYFFVSKTVGKDDPIFPEEKVRIYQKVFPQQATIFEPMGNLNQALSDLAGLGYQGVVVVVGADQKQAFQYLEKPNKEGVPVYQSLGLKKLRVISRQETNSKFASEEGPRATPMREILLDPNATEEDKFKVWRRDMPDQLSDRDVLDVMNKAESRLLHSNAPKSSTKVQAMSKKVAKLKEAILSFKVKKQPQQPQQTEQEPLGYKHLFKPEEPTPEVPKQYHGWQEYEKEQNPDEVEEARIIMPGSKVNVFFHPRKGGSQIQVAKAVPMELAQKVIASYVARNQRQGYKPVSDKEFEIRPIDITQYSRSSQPELAEGKFNELSVMIADYYNMSLSDVKFYGMYGITRQQFAKDYAQYLDKPKQVNEFAPSDMGDNRPNFLPWNEFIGDLKAILGDHFDVVENVVKSTIKARFVPHDPMEFGPTMLYSYYEARAGRNKGAVSTRGAIQVGKYVPNTSGLGKQNYITTFNLLKGHPFERHFDLTGENVQKIADIIIGNTEGAYQMQPQQVKEFAPPGSNDGGDDGFSEETLKRLAAQWYNGDEDPRVERTLMAAGWEIGQDEGYDDEPGVFVVQSGDTNGDSYLSWPAHELRQPMNEDYLDE